MRHLKKMVDMSYTAEDLKPDATEPPPPVASLPWGLSIRLTERELEKLDLEETCEVGDMLHGFFMAKVTHVSSSDREGMKPTCSIELQISHLSVEDEDEENEEADMRAEKRYNGKRGSDGD